MIISILGIICIALLLSGCCCCTGSQVYGPTATPIPKVKVTAYNLNIAYTGSTSGYLGPTSQVLSTYSFDVNGGQAYTDTITLYTSALLFDHQIDSITINTPGFTLLSVQPSLPYKFSPDSSMALTLKIQTPNYDYNGPVNILITTS